MDDRKRSKEQVNKAFKGNTGETEKTAHEEDKQEAVSSASEDQNTKGTDTGSANTVQDVAINTVDIIPRSFIEMLPSEQGTLLAAVITNIMTEGLTAQQENILGNFISSIGTLISYKASRDDLDENRNK